MLLRAGIELVCRLCGTHSQHHIHICWADVAGICLPIPCIPNTLSIAKAWTQALGPYVQGCSVPPSFRHSLRPISKQSLNETQLDGSAFQRFTAISGLTCALYTMTQTLFNEVLVQALVWSLHTSQACRTDVTHSKLTFHHRWT